MTPSSEPKIHSCDAWRDPGPAVPIGTALRLVGLDEHAIARNYVHVLDQLTKPAAEAGSAEKLAVEILKECSRQIEAAQEVERSPNAGAPVIVQLVHTVSRPARVLPALPKAADAAPPKLEAATERSS